MKVNYTVIALALIGVAGAVVGAYQYGHSTQAVAPAAAPAPDPATAGFSHFRVGNRNVKAMFADGPYVWVGTSGGVIRYDTRSDDYQLFNNKNSGLLSNGIFHISKLGERMVVGTYGGGMALFDTKANRWETVNIPQGLADQFVYDVVKARNGDVWIATWSGANRVKNGEFDNAAAWETFTVENTRQGLPNPWVYGIEEGADGAMWFATEAGLARYKDGVWKNWKHEDGLGADFDVVKDDIAFKSDPAAASRHHAQQKAEQGLGKVSVAYNPNYVISMVVDRQGVVWCGTWGGGLARFDGKTWRNYTTKDGLPSNHIFMLYQDTNGVLWIGTDRGLARFGDGGRGFKVMTVADGLYADNVFSMAASGDGTLWVGSFGGVAHFERPL